MGEERRWFTIEEAASVCGAFPVKTPACLPGSILGTVEQVKLNWAEVKARFSLEGSKPRVTW